MAAAVDAPTQAESDEAPLTPAHPALRVESVRIPAANRPLLFVVVDTEEEFDWSAPFSRANTGVRAMRQIGRLQTLFSAYHVKPTYVVDFPIVNEPGGCDPLKEFVADDQARIGAHLHPWVNPPFVEEISARNSYGFRLGAALETEKIRILRCRIADQFGQVPRVYKAGRYGFGLSTIAALESLDFAVDLSVNPRMNFCADGGPSFEAFDATPFFFGRTRRLLEIPCSTDYTGVVAETYAPRLHRLISHPRLARTHVVGVMARIGVVNRVTLSPEGSTLGEMVALTRALFRRGVRTFSFTLHSPSVEPGCTPYVRTAGDLREFLDRIAAYCDFFFGDLGGVPGTPEEFLTELDAPTSSVGSAAHHRSV